jgi:transcriptional regulator with XRE-family HTH domain
MNIQNTRKTRTQLRPFEVTIPAEDGRRIADRVRIQVPMRWHEEIGEWVLTAEAEELIETTKARHMGLLLPEQLHALRLRHGLTQREIGDLLRIGGKSWTRWETGKQRPSQSMNLLLCAVDRGLISPQQLAELGATRRDWSAQFREMAKAGPTNDPVVIDFCRARDSLADGRAVPTLEVRL